MKKNKNATGFQYRATPLHERDEAQHERVGAMTEPGEIPISRGAEQPTPEWAVKAADEISEIDGLILFIDGKCGSWETESVPTDLIARIVAKYAPKEQPASAAGLSGRLRERIGEMKHRGLVELAADLELAASLLAPTAPANALYQQDNHWQMRYDAEITSLRVELRDAKLSADKWCAKWRDETDSLRQQLTTQTEHADRLEREAADLQRWLNRGLSSNPNDRGMIVDKPVEGLPGMASWRLRTNDEWLDLIADLRAQLQAATEAKVRAEAVVATKEWQYKQLEVVREAAETKAALAGKLAEALKRFMKPSSTIDIYPYRIAQAEEAIADYDSAQQGGGK